MYDLSDKLVNNFVFIFFTINKLLNFKFRAAFMRLRVCVKCNFINFSITRPNLNTLK